MTSDSSSRIGLALHFFWLSNRNEGPLELRPQPLRQGGLGADSQAFGEFWHFLQK